MLGKLLAKLAARRAKREGLKLRRGLDRENEFLLRQIDRELEQLERDVKSLEAETGLLAKLWRGE